MFLSRFVEHDLIVEKETSTIEWKARKSIQQKQSQLEEEAATRPKQASAEEVPTEKNKDIHLLEMGGEKPSEAEAKTGKHEYTHHLK